jgi:hypothetical protein
LLIIFKLNNIAIQLNNQQKALQQGVQQEHNRKNTNANGKQPIIPKLPETESSEMPTFWKMIGKCGLWEKRAWDGFMMQ